jgi:hypothetical protein
MAKSEALEALDNIINGQTHATLNAKPGVYVLDELRKIRNLVDDIDEVEN